MENVRLYRLEIKRVGKKYAIGKDVFNNTYKIVRNGIIKFVAGEDYSFHAYPVKKMLAFRPTLHPIKSEEIQKETKANIEILDKVRKINLK